MSIQAHQPSIEDLSPEKIDLLKKTICKGSTNEELELFIHACNRTRLDPFMRQIYAIKRGNVMGIQTGIDGYRLIAERTGRYMPGKEPTFMCDEKGRLISATSYVKKLASDGSWHEIGATALLAEYECNTPLWKKMPYLMIAKCSEALALRRAFPADLSGIYTKEEMDQADNEVTVTPTIKQNLPVEMITEEQAENLEDLLSREDSGSRELLLQYFTNVNKSKNPYGDFLSLTKDQYEATVRKIAKKAEKSKKTEEEVAF